jgi:predicted nucleic acid-binding protein
VTYLLDTNVVSELRKGSRGDSSLIAWISTVAPKALYTSVLVIGELRRGIEGIRRRDDRQAKAYENWLEQVRLAFAGRILDIDERIAEEWGRLNVPDPLPAIDGLLAATAKVHSLALATRNVADVSRTGVSTIDPFSWRRGSA